MQTIAFVVHVHKEPIELVRDCVDRITKAHPGTQIHLVLDNPMRRDIEQSPYVRKTRRLKGIDSGADWWRRFFQLAFAITRGFRFQWVAKIDPDTRVHRRMCSMPTDAEIVGHLDRRNDGIHDHIQGGCQIFSESHLDALHLESCSEEYLDPDYWRNDECEDLIKRGMISSDYMLAKMAKNIGVKMVDHPEIDCRGTEEELIEKPFREGAAITHPHKDWTK